MVSRGLFVLGLLLALGLVALVVAAPFAEEAGSGGRIVALFAQDSGLRRTCLASAAGLVVTACVFFRSGSRGRSGGRTKPPVARPRGSGMAGA